MNKYIELDIEINVNHSSIGITAEAHLDEIAEAITSEQLQYLIAVSGGQDHRHLLDQAIIHTQNQTIPAALFEYLAETTGREVGIKGSYQ